MHKLFRYMRMIRKLYDNEDDTPIQTRFSLITMTRKVAETMGEELIWTLSGLVLAVVAVTPPSSSCSPAPFSVSLAPS